MSRNEAAIYLDDVRKELERLPSAAMIGTSRPTSPVQQKLRAKGQHAMTTAKSIFTNYKGTKHNHKSRHEMLPRFRNDDDDDDDENDAVLVSDDKDDVSRNRILTGGDDDVDYNDLLERLRIADFLYKEYSLEEVIYQLAREMFVQSIVKGNRDAEESLQRFSNFLQAETAQGRISKELEKKILDVVMAALMDAVSEQPQQQQQQQSADDNEAVHASTRPHSAKSKYKSLMAKNKSRELKQIVKKNTKSSEVGSSSSSGGGGGGGGSEDDGREANKKPSNENSTSATEVEDADETQSKEHTRKVDGGGGSSSKA